VNPKKFLIELKRRNVSESRDRKRGHDADQQYCLIKGVFVRCPTGLLSIALLKESAEGGLQGAFLDLFILVRRLIRE
jgi:hypothetical protein